MLTKKLIKEITNGGMCNLCNEGWHELREVKTEGDQVQISVFCVESNTSKLINLPSPKV